MNTGFVILNEVKNPRVACRRCHGFFTSFKTTVEAVLNCSFPASARAWFALSR
jgi:hypothetical protein